MQTRVYQKETNRNLPRLIMQSLKDLNDSRFLAFQLAKRDITAQYRQSFLGILWAFITPLATAAVWIILNNTGTVNLKDTSIPYPVFTFVGTLLWSIVTESINAPLTNTTAAKTILTKINFPKEAIVVSGILKLWFNSIVKIVIMFIFIFVYQVELGWSMLLFPIAVFAGTLIGTTIGLILTPIGMLYKDVGKFVGFSLKFIMYASPVVYSILWFNSIVKIVIMFIFIFVYQVELGWSMLLFPIAVFAGTLIGTTIGLILTPIGMLYKDVGKFVGFSLKFIMYASPVVYSIPDNGFMRTVMEWNPLTPIIVVGRNLATNMPLEYLTYFLIVLAATIPLLFLALIFYRISIPIFVERLSS